MLFRSACVAFDANWREAKSTGMSDADADAFAWQRTAEVVGQTAQPQHMIDKSLLEVEWPTMGRLIFAFQGAARQAWSLMYQSAIHFQKHPGRSAQTLALYGVLVPVLTHVMGGLVRYATSDDDWEDEWKAGDFGNAIKAAPGQGLVVVGPIWEAFVGSDPRQIDQPITSDLRQFLAAVNKLKESDEEREKRPKAERDFDAKDLGKILDGLSTAVGGRGSAIGVANNILQQFMGARAAAKEGDQERESFQAAKNRKDAEKDAEAAKRASTKVAQAGSP